MLNPAASIVPLEVTVGQVKAMLDSGRKVAMIDVREVPEHATARVDVAELIPMNTVPQKLQYLKGKADEATLVIFCHHGMRSLMVVNWLREHGVAPCTSMSGGIHQWSVEVDNKVPIY